MLAGSTRIHGSMSLPPLKKFRIHSYSHGKLLGWDTSSIYLFAPVLSCDPVEDGIRASRKYIYQYAVIANHGIAQISDVPSGVIQTPLNDPQKKGEMFAPHPKPYTHFAAQ